MILTFQDAVESLIDYLGAQVSDSVLRDAKKACIDALRDLVQAHPWTYLYEHGRINIVQAYSQGQVTYAVEGVQVPNQVTLTGGVWPAWAALGTLRVNDLNYDVLYRISDTVIQLSPDQASPSDWTDPQVYGLFQDTYDFPEDFLSIDVAFIPNNFGGLQYTHPREWLMNIASCGVLGDPVLFTVMASNDRPGRTCAKLAPFPTNPDVIEYIYKRHANPLTIYKVATGTVSTMGPPIPNNQVVGNGTNFTQAMAGNTILRISADPKKLPTSTNGDNPADFESKVTTVLSPTSLFTWDTIPSAYTNMPYTISSYVDIEVGPMEQAYHRCTEKHVSIKRIMKDKPSANLQYKEALEIAKCADSPSMFPRTAGPPVSVRRRLKDYPIDLSREQ
jgi:hypothetical protein